MGRPVWSVSAGRAAATAGWSAAALPAASRSCAVVLTAASELSSVVAWSPAASASDVPTAAVNEVIIAAVSGSSAARSAWWTARASRLAVSRSRASITAGCAVPHACNGCSVRAVRPLRATSSDCPACI